MEVKQICKEDFDQILSSLPDFWEDRHSEVRALHHPMFVFEFGEYGLVIKETKSVVGYLLGFVILEKRLGYVHFIGVHKNKRKLGLAKKLYLQFMESAKLLGCNRIKAITTSKNIDSIRFHEALGFKLQGQLNSDGIAVVSNYRGPGEDRVVFLKNLSP